MGKAARIRKHRGIALRERSAYSRAWKASRLALDRYHSNGQIDRTAAETARYVLERLPRSRAYRYRDWGLPDVPIRQLATDLHVVHFPFPLAFLDAGSLSLGTNGDGRPIELVGILCAESEKGTWEKPTAIALTVVADGTDEWWTPILMPLFAMEEGFRLNDESESEIVDETIAGEATKALLTMLAMLECVNVEVLPALDPPRKGHVAHGVPYFDVVVRNQETRREPPEEHHKVNWSHSWEVAANFAYYTRGAIFEAAPPEKRIFHPERGECVRVWRRSHVRGRGPLIPKVRIVGGT